MYSDEEEDDTHEMEVVSNPVAASFKSPALWNPRELKRLGFQIGSILKIAVANFMTFDECIAFPKPRLNVILGPNGAGKSSLTQAMCLACCGSALDIGRQKDLANFVKNDRIGSSECFVEVCFLGEKDTVYTVRRVIQAANNTSKWFVNERSFSNRDVKRLMRHYSIDMSNLCNFMSQDKVGDFTRFSANENLHNTLKCIPSERFISSGNNSAEDDDEDAKRTLYDELKQLSDVEKDKIGMQKSVETLEKKRTSLESLVNTMKVEVDRLDSREATQKLLRLYRIKKAVLENAGIERECEEKQQLLDVANQLLSTEREKQAPLHARARTLEAQQAKKEKTLSSAEEKLKICEASLKDFKDKITNQCDESLESTSQAVCSIDTTRRDKERELARFQSQKQEFENKLNQLLVEQPRIEATIADMTSKVNEMQLSIPQLDDQIEVLNSKVEESIRIIRSHHQELGNLQSARQKFKHKLKGMVNRPNCHIKIKSAYEAMEWLDNNQAGAYERGQLTQDIFGPVVAYLEVSNPACAAMLEKSIPVNQLYGWVVMNEHDKRFLDSELRHKQGLKFDIYTATNFEQPAAPYSSAQLNQLRDLNVQYLSQAVTCPDAVRVALDSFSNLYTILWARQRNSSLVANIDDVGKALWSTYNSRFKLYVHNENSSNMDITEYSGVCSKYATGNQGSLSSQSVYARGDIGGHEAEVDVEARRDDLLQRIRVKEEENLICSNELKEHQETKRKLTSEISSLNRSKQQLVQQLRQPVDWKSRVVRIDREIEGVQRYLRGDSEAEKRRKLIEYEKCLDSVLEKIGACIGRGEECVQLKANKNVAFHYKHDLREELERVRSELKRTQEDIELAKRKVKDAEMERNRITEKRQRLTDILNEIIAREGGENNYQRTYQEMQQECPEDNLGAVEVRVDTLEAELESTVDNPNLKIDYRRVCKEFEEADRQYLQASKEMEGASTHLASKAEAWEKDVLRVAEQMNSLFHEYMRDMGFDGEVELRRNGAYDLYELQMRVKFDMSGELSDLSWTKHSGGERAVSTLMYLMALQKLTSAPFRVVDEINQGMDEKNERLVLDRIVRNCCTSDNPQYFLVTPKLLPALRCLENDMVNVMLICNGPGIFHKFQFEDQLQVYRNMIK